MKHEMAVTSDIPATLVCQPDGMAALCQYVQVRSPRRKMLDQVRRGYLIESS